MLDLEVRPDALSGDRVFAAIVVRRGLQRLKLFALPDFIGMMDVVIGGDAECADRDIGIHSHDLRRAFLREGEDVTADILAVAIDREGDDRWIRVVGGNRGRAHDEQRDRKSEPLRHLPVSPNSSTGTGRHQMTRSFRSFWITAAS